MASLEESVKRSFVEVGETASPETIASIAEELERRGLDSQDLAHMIHCYLTGRSPEVAAAVVESRRARKN